MKHIDLRRKNNKQSYLRYNDVFMSRGNPANNRNNHSEAMQRGMTRDSPYPDRFCSRPSQNDAEYRRNGQYLDQYDDESEEIFDQRGEQPYDQRPLGPYDRDYFSNNSSILNERMVKYQKRQLPPLHRYGSNSRNNYPAPQMMYWGEDEEEQNKYSRNHKKYSQFGTIWQKFIVTFASMLSLVCLTWIAYNWNGGPHHERAGGSPVIIEPEQPSFKILPDQPRGIEIEHKDKTVYDRLHPGSSQIDIEERVLPPQEDPMNVQPNGQVVPKSLNKIEECSIVDDDRIYYIKFSAGKNKHILESEAKLMKKKYGKVIGNIKCEVKKVSNAQGEQKHAILIGPFDDQDSALDLARQLGGQCYIVSVKE